ncbi:uncharacterized protein DFL_004496 [Arthrobotrys flagrans]|uniref:F-box domain-containing protein n=1 Tax=Arthrobotrys flagrans TaxID=97331 RepID=A0A437A573_ARTFL|nr:hypothetical protein DFL_004496 [Arthrobotrys flagrans]
MELDNPPGDLLLTLPTEIWYHVLSFLDAGDKMLFARCSWFCFFIAFPNGVRIPDVDYKWSLQPFADGGRLAAFKHRIHSARFDIADVNDVLSFFHKIAIFPNLRRLEISANAYQFEVFDGLLSLLSKQPYYENLSHIALAWHLTYDTAMAYLEKETKFLNSLSHIPVCDKTLETIAFPQSLRSLTLFASRLKCVMPLINCERVTNLVLLHPMIKPTDYIFWNIKTLTLDTQYPTAKLNLNKLPTVFPSVESFSFPRTRPGAPDENWILHIPKFPKMKTLSTAWPQIDGRNAEIETLETALQTKLSTSNDLRALETVTFSGYRDFADHRRNIVATCVISRTGSQKPGEGLEFKWHGNISNYQDDPSYWNSLLDDSSGDDWEAGNTDGEDSEVGDDDDFGMEDREDYDSEYFENMTSDDELYVRDSLGESEDM